MEESGGQRGGRSRFAEYVLHLALGLPAEVSAQEPFREELRAARLPRGSRERNRRACAELLRSALRAEQLAALTETMQCTEGQDAAFWPILREYECDLALLNDERLAIIEAYADGTLTDGTSNELMARALDLESRRIALQQQYHTTLRTALSPRMAARALQIEQQIQFLIDLQVAASLPARR